MQTAESRLAIASEELGRVLPRVHPSGAARAKHDRSGNGNALPLSTRELCRIPVTEIGEIH